MNNFFESLTFKIGAIIILVEIVVLTVTGFFYINRFSSQVDQRVRARVELPGDLVARGLLNFGSVADKEMMTALVGEDLVAGMVVGANKMVLHSLDPTYVRREVTGLPGIDPAWFDEDMTDNLLVEMPDGLISITPIRIFANEKATFFVYIKVGTEQAEPEKRTIVGLFVLGSIFSVLITSATIIYLFNSTILSRIKGLLNILSRVEAGDLTARINDTILPDEIGLLQQGVNSMAARLEETVGRLERRVADLDQARETLKAYAAELERSNHELENYANVAAHDLQEPLRKVQAFGDRIKTKYGDILDERGCDYLERMQNAAARMQALINDLLTFSRVTTQAHPFAPVDLTEVVQEVLSDLETYLETVNGRVELSDLPTIDADRLQMRQLLQNLMSNALKFHRPEEPPLVKIEGYLLPNENRPGAGDLHKVELCQIKVIDNGIGFDEKYLDRIFTVFQRLHGRNGYEGTGIGLAICRKIVERHGGTITAQSTPGQGAAFIVTLPVKQATVE